MTPEQDQLLRELASRTDSLETLFANHKHQEFDKSKPLDTAASGSTAHVGRITSNAAGAVFPSGWSVNHTGTGFYKITHNLGTTAYTVTATAIDVLSVMKLFAAPGANDFTLVASSVAGAFQDGDFDFHVIMA